MSAIQKRLAVALLCTAAVLVAGRHTYWRPFDDTPQESMASGHAYGFAAASVASLWPNPVVARYPNPRRGVVGAYPHWPNGFFLIFETYLRLFGRTEIAGRWFAILGNLAGFTLVLLSLGRDDWLVFLTLPLLALSAIGRDALSFVFNDVGLCFSIGLLMYLGTRALGPSGDRLFRAGVLVCLFVNYLIAPYAAGIALLRWYERRSFRTLAMDLTVLAAGTAVVLGACAAARTGGLEAGLSEAERIYAYRSDRTLADVYRLLNLDLRLSLNLEPVSSHVVALAWLIVVAARQWRVAFLMPSFLMFTVLLREYVVSHHFTRLPFVFFCLITVAVAVAVVLERLPVLRERRLAATAVQAVVALLLAVRLAGGIREYRTDPAVQVTRQRLFGAVARAENRSTLARCGAFRYIRPEGQTLGTMALSQLFFGPQVVQRFVRGAPLETCQIDLTTEAVELVANDPIERVRR